MQVCRRDRGKADQTDLSDRPQNPHTKRRIAMNFNTIMHKRNTDLWNNTLQFIFYTLRFSCLLQIYKFIITSRIKKLISSSHLSSNQVFRFLQVTHPFLKPNLVRKTTAAASLTIIIINPLTTPNATGSANATRIINSHTETKLPNYSFFN